MVPGMCLLAVLHRVHPDGPLVVAANRDEVLARPSLPMAVLREREPRVLGGRDELAGGTWLAVNEHGLAAGLTNVPGPRDPSKRSRGELPLALALHADAERAAEAFAAAVRPLDYGPAWLLVGDRRSLHYVSSEGGERPRLERLPPGLHVLENRPLGAPSPKADHVRAALARATSLRGEALLALLGEVLGDHAIPPGAAALAEGRRALETHAACVHAGAYGTRSSSIVVVPEGPGPPRLWFTRGPPCTSPFEEASPLWRAGEAAPRQPGR